MKIEKMESQLNCKELKEHGQALLINNTEQVNTLLEQAEIYF